MLNWLSRKASSVTADQFGGLLGWVGYRAAGGQSVSWQSAVQVSAVFCAVRVISEGLAQAPVRILRERYDAGRGRVVRRVDVEHDVARLFARRPNAWQTPFQFVEYAAIAAALDGGFLAIKATDSRGRVRELLPVPMGCWTVRHREDYSLEFTVSYADKTHDIFDLSQVFYFCGPTLNTYSGASAVGLAREAIGLAASLEQQQARMSGRGGLPSGILSFDAPLSPERQKKLVSAWGEKYGPGGNGGVAILDAGAKFSAMTMTSVDAQHLETRKHQIEEVARFWRIFPIMLMQMDKTATFASAEQMFRAHVIHTLSPWMKRFEQSINRDLLTDEPGLRADMDERALLRGDFADQAEYYSKALGSGGSRGWMTQNEIRAERDMNPLDDPRADELPMGAMEDAGDGV